MAVRGGLELDSRAVIVPGCWVGLVEITPRRATKGRADVQTRRRGAFAARRIAAPGLVVLRSPGPRSRAAAALCARSRLRRSRADGAQPRRLLRARLARQRPGPGAQQPRYPASVQH